MKIISNFNCLFILTFILIAGTLSTIYKNGFPNEFVYNIPYVRFQLEGLLYTDPVAIYSQQFINPLIYTIIFLVKDLNGIYLTYIGLNFVLFFIAAITLYKDKTLGTAYVLIFFLLSAKVITTGISSSFHYTTLLMGYALVKREMMKSHYGVAVATYFIYPISSLTILATSFFLSLQKRSLIFACTSLAIGLLLIFFTNFFGYKVALNDYYTNFLGWDVILKDPYFFSDSMIPIAKNNSYFEIFKTILGDGNRIGTTLFSLYPFDTPRFVALLVIVFTALISKDFIAKNKHGLVFYFSILMLMYIIAFSFAFKFYFPNRWVIGPLFLYITHLTLASFVQLLNYCKKVFFSTALLSFSIIIIFYQFFPILGTPVKAENYLNYVGNYQSEKFEQLVERLKEEQGKIVAASPRLSEMLLISDARIVPIITYKFIDKTTSLKIEGRKFWNIYLASNEERLRSLCVGYGIDYIIFEKSLLEILKRREFNKARRNFMMPHRDGVDSDSLAIIDYFLEHEKIGDYYLVTCARDGDGK